VCVRIHGKKGTGGDNRQDRDRDTETQRHIQTVKRQQTETESRETETETQRHRDTQRASTSPTDVAIGIRTAETASEAKTIEAAQRTLNCHIIVSRLVPS